MSKIGVISDLHLKPFLSYSDYLPDKRQAEKQEILDFIVKSFKNCQTIVFLGDSFDKKNNPSETVREFTNFVEQFEDKEIFILAGNHEIKGNGETAIDYLEQVKNKKWHIITNKIETFGQYTFCPYFSNIFLEVKNNEEGQKKLLGQLKGGTILFVHHAISDTLINDIISTNYFNEIVLPREELEKRYRLIIGGHIHKPQKLPETKDSSFFIIGSVFNEEVNEREKRILQINDKTLNVFLCRVKSIPLPGRGIYKLENPTLKDLSVIEKNNIVKVILTKPISKEDKEKLQKELSKFDAHLILEQYPIKRKKVSFEKLNLLEYDINQLLKIYAIEKKVSLEKLLSAWELIK